MIRGAHAQWNEPVTRTQGPFGSARGRLANGSKTRGSE